MSVKLLRWGAGPRVTVTLNHSSVSGSCTGDPCTATSSTPDSGITVASPSPAGGTHLWEYVSGNASIAALTPNSANTSWRATNITVAEGNRQAVWRHRYTLGATAFSGNVTITLSNVT